MRHARLPSNQLAAYSLLAILRAMPAPASASENLWARFEQAAPKPAKSQATPFGWVLNAIFPLTLITAASIAVLLPQTLSREARLSLLIFSVAAILWSTTKLNAAYVALAATLALVACGASKQEAFFNALASDVIWLIIGAFILGGAVQKTGLAARLTQLVVSRARTVRGVFYLITTVLIPLTLLIPSTSGRAAIALPIFRSIAGSAGDPKISRALALLMPTIILVATIASLIGAGSHLVANDLLEQVAGQNISFARWMLWGTPFALVASYLSAWVVMWQFLDPERRARELKIPPAKSRSLSRGEWTTLGVIAAMMALWFTERAHHFEIATVATVGAVVLTLPGFGPLSWKDGLKAVSWNLVIFVGAALVVGRALIESGAAQWIMEQLFAASGIAETRSPLLVLLVLSFLTLTSHIYMTSHVARAAALIPTLLYLGKTLGLNPVAVVFIATVGMDYCLTFPVSSKALLIFQEVDEETFEPADLLKLSAVLLIGHVALMFVFYLGYWQWVGLKL
jgi:anion transporter